MEMCVDNPREGFADLFSTHPSVDSRVAALVKFAGGHDPGRLALPSDTADGPDDPGQPGPSAPSGQTPPPPPGPWSNTNQPAGASQGPWVKPAGPWGRH
jgi:heat shock protein HtpX